MIGSRVFKAITVLGLMLASCGSSLSLEEDRYIGLKVPPFPANLKTLSDKVISQERGFPLTMALVQEQDTGNSFLLLGAKEGDGKTYIIVQQISLGTLKNGETVMHGVFYQCGVAGRYDEDLVLFGNAKAPEEQPYITTFKQGWRINYETKQLDEISLGDTDYRCENVAHTL